MISVKVSVSCSREGCTVTLERQRVENWTPGWEMTPAGLPPDWTLLYNGVWRVFCPACAPMERSPLPRDGVMTSVVASGVDIADTLRPLAEEIVGVGAPLKTAPQAMTGFAAQAARSLPFVEAEKRRQACERCYGCGLIADTPAGEPWVTWTNLPKESRVALAMGVVKPIPCPACAAPNKHYGCATTTNGAHEPGPDCPDKPNCPPDCGGACHIAPPCGHCTDHAPKES